ncbi:MAG: serine/threonine-protein kinase [Acidimicrobiales bacterium]
MPAEPPRSLLGGRYRVGPVVGRGAMGEVRTAHDERLQRDVAIKFLRADLTVDPSARGRFEEEAHAAARISHPSAVTVFDTGEQDGAAYIVMECLPGRTLADEIGEGALAPERARRVLADVVGALEVAHELGVLHRDVKPGNILLTADGRAKLADFGIAKTAEGLNHTMTGQVMGTPAYMAPERLEGHPATPESDLYAVGVVLYEALVGRRPFPVDTPMAVVKAVCEADVVPIDELLPDIDPDLARTVAQAMDRRPEHRFRSAGDLRVALDPDATADAPPQVAADAMALTVALSIAPRTEVFTTPPALEPEPESVFAEPAPPPGVPTGATARSGPSRRSVAGAAAAVALLAGFWFAQRDDAGTPSSATSTSTPEASGLPPELDGAIEDLEAVVQP